MKTKREMLDKFIEFINKYWDECEWIAGIQIPGDDTMMIIGTDNSHDLKEAIANSFKDDKVDRKAAKAEKTVEFGLHEKKRST